MMAGSRIAIVWNPSKTSREDLEGALPASAADAEVMWFETSPDDPGQGATSDALAAGAEVVVAAGGDGTVRAVAERLAQDDAAELAIVPLGTGNLLARNLGVPLGDPGGALTRAFEGRSRAIDLGWVTTDVNDAEVRRAFAVIAGIGIDAHMIVETDDDLKSKVGWLAYVESLGRALSSSEVVDIEIAVDGAAPERTEAHTLLVGNCGTLQGGVALLPDADPSDGELDLLLLSAEGIGQWLDTVRSFVWDNGIRRFFTGRERAESADTATHARVGSVSVVLSEPRALEVDGDELGETSGFTIEIQPGAVRVR
ncbi:diacylglycerol kinase family protein [Glycomyces luteolus]|uniref:Diacylglycerol kinase family protein n=1 Tax=Glycomyces luteolus TaxID=2670330 RepID=A0A9X3PAG3_9ACTN|nr:diacylglycerol kinase family protein [Glycomyces luteolus]MDA1358924.1 diacylglycerol kinase family protein [Glycomyces luteolus]